VKEELAKGNRKQFIVLHTYGSHFNYRERYPAGAAFFRPDSPADAEFKYRDNLINAYDNSIRYTDDFLARLIGLLQQQDAGAAMLYTSDHGEDIFDDDRHLFLHASPVPSYYQLHVPFIVWTSDTYREKYPEHIAALQQNRQKSVASNRVVFHSLLDLAGVTTAYVNDSLSVASPSYTEFPRFYLNDHNEPRAYDDIGLRKEDFEMFRKMNIR
jgi:glucan phosphoethanolaminetransferase (alkaline phosphatase superfamily)